MFSRARILFLVSFFFVGPFDPYSPFKFLIFYHSSLFTFYRYTKFYRRLLNNYGLLQALVNNLLV